MEMQIEKCPNYGWVESGLYRGVNPQKSGDLRDKIRIRVIGITARDKRANYLNKHFCSDGLLSVG